MALPVKLTAAQVRAIANATNAVFDVNQQKGLVAMLDLGIAAAASATVAGTVLKAATVANAVAAVPAAAPAGGVGAAAGGWDTAGNRDLAIATINGLRTDVIELQTQLNAVLTSMRTAGQIV